MRWFIADLRTGRDIMDIQVMDSSKGKRSINTPESLTAVLDMQDPATIALHPRQTAAPTRTCLVCANDSIILGAGPIWSRTYDRPAKTLTLNAAGLWSYFDHRYVLPIAAATVDPTTFIVPDPSAAGKTMPNSALATSLTSLEYGTIAKRWIAQAQAWTGGNVPIVFEPDRTGTDQRNFDGVDMKNLGTALQELSQVEGGPDIRFVPQFTPDGLGIQWALQTGTDANPLLGATVPQVWDLSVPNSGISKFAVDEQGANMASIAWATAGRTADTALVSRSTDTTLTDLGYALLERLDSSHFDVKDQATLNQWAADDTLAGRRPIETWAFTVETRRQPYLGSYWEGDYVTVKIPAYDPSTGLGDPYLYEQTTSQRRITALGWDALGLTVDLVTQEVV